MKNKKKAIIFIIVLVGIVGLYGFSNTNKYEGVLASLSSPILGSESIQIRENFLDNESDDSEISTTSSDDLSHDFQKEKIDLPENNLSYEDFKKEIAERAEKVKDSVQKSTTSFRENIEEEINRRIYRQVCEDLEY